MSWVLGQRIFSNGDQELFANLSGDRNPIHLDPIAARRTQAGAPIVHGMHVLLWCLNLLAGEYPYIAAPKTLKVRFDKLVFPEKSVEAIVLRHNNAGCDLEARVDRTVVLRLAVKFGPARASPTQVVTEMEVLYPDAPLELPFEAITRQAGRIGFAASPTAAAAAFPAAANWCGPQRIAGLMCLTRLVGMICPGLHSLFGGFTVEFTTEREARDSLGFRVSVVDPRFRVVRLAIAGAGLDGTVETFARLPPIEQPNVRDLVGIVGRDEFAGASVLVIGGSRGLGEVTAKFLAAGGAQVVLTYAVGRLDATRVKDEIRAAGGACDIIHYDSCVPAAQQFTRLALPTYIYYFASPPIFHQDSGIFDADRFRRFCRFYVDGFYDLCTYLTHRNSNEIRLFYPSSIAVQSRPAGMTEYAMAKAAGEVLCADLNAQQSNLMIVTARLPRVLTDQTATITHSAAAGAIDVLRSLIRQVQAKN